jgi:hypothetical protein
MSPSQALARHGTALTCTPRTYLVAGAHGMPKILRLVTIATMPQARRAGRQRRLGRDMMKSMEATQWTV